MDALAMNEENELPFRSQREGIAHTCGHDGHTAALLGTAKHLVAHPPASGQVVPIFQPAEAGGRGANRMTDDGTFTRLPLDEVVALDRKRDGEGKDLSDRF